MIVEKRADGEVQTEATIKIWIDGERRVTTAEGNGPVNALDGALRAAIGEVHPHLADIELVNFKVRILDEDKGTGAVTRVLLDSSDGTERVGHDRRLGERDRGLVGGARRLARARHAGRAAVVSAEEIPLARPVLGEAEERGVLEVLRSGRLSLGPLLGEFERRFAAAHRRAARERRLERHRRAAPGAARGRRQRRRRGHHEPVLVRRLGQRDRLRARAAGVRRHRPAHADDRPGGRRGGRQRRARRRCCRSTSSAGPPTSRRSSSSGCRSSRTPARRSARATPTASRSARAATRPSSPSTPTSS